MDGLGGVFELGGLVAQLVVWSIGILVGLLWLIGIWSLSWLIVYLVGFLA